MFDFSSMYLKEYTLLFTLLLKKSHNSRISDELYELRFENDRLSLLVKYLDYYDEMEFVFRGSSPLNRIEYVERRMGGISHNYEFEVSKIFRMVRDDKSETNAMKFNLGIGNELLEVLSNINKLENQAF